MRPQRVRNARTISTVLYLTLFLALSFASLAFTLASSAGGGPASSPAPDASTAIQAAQRQFNAGNYSAAIATLQSAVSQDPSSAEAYYWLGRSYYELHDFNNAVPQAEKSVSLDPKNSLYHQWLGRTYGDKADHDRSFSLAKKVKKEFEAAVALNPSNIVARRDLEQYCIDAPWIAGGSKDQALDQVNAIAPLDPVQGHLARAVYDRDGLKNISQAEDEYRKALASKPNRIEPYFEIADFFEFQNKPADIRAAIQGAADINANDARIAYYRAVAGVLANENGPAAEKDLKAYLATSPDRTDWPSHAAAREWLGRLYEEQGKRSEAAEQYRAALQLEPQRKEARARLEKLGKASQ